MMTNFPQQRYLELRPTAKMKCGRKLPDMSIEGESSSNTDTSWHEENLIQRNRGWKEVAVGERGSHSI